jgi:hypothetical protein
VNRMVNRGSREIKTGNAASTPVTLAHSFSSHSFCRENRGGCRHRWKRSPPEQVRAAPPPPFFSYSPSLLLLSLQRHPKNSSGGCPWPPEKGGDGIAAGPLASARARPRLSSSPSSSLAGGAPSKAPCAAWTRPPAAPLRRAGGKPDGSFFLPRDGDASGGMRAEVGPHSSLFFFFSRVRVSSLFVLDC